MVQTKGEKVVVLVPLLLRIRLAAAPQQQAAAAAGAKSHVDVHPVADYPASAVSSLARRYLLLATGKRNLKGGLLIKRAVPLPGGGGCLFQD